MVISFSTGVLLFKWVQSFQHSQDHLSVSQHCSFHPSPSCLCFSRPPTLLLQGLGCLNQVSILLMQSLFILFNQCSYRVVLMKMFFKCFSHAGVSLNHSPLVLHVFRSVEDISGDSCFHSRSVQAILRLLSHSSHLIQPV